MEFHEEFNQLEFLETHQHLIPVGTQSMWPDDDDDEDYDDDEEEREGFRSEEWYQQQEKGWRIGRENCCYGPLRGTGRDEDRYTPLHRAAYSGHLEVARTLVHHAADLHARTVDGWTPLHSACRWNNTSVASYLIQQGALVNAQTNGLLTPLHLAAGNSGAKPTLELLLTQRHIQAELKSSSGETAFDIARRTSAHYHLFEIVEPYNNLLPQS